MRIKKMKLEVRNRNSKKSRKSVFAILFFLFSIFFSLTSNAQCAMCRASLESSGDVSQAEAVNDGIVYLMIIPYVLVGLIGFAIYRMFRKKP
jgi:hypothetical protein